MDKESLVFDREQILTLFRIFGDLLSSNQFVGEVRNSGARDKKSVVKYIDSVQEGIFRDHGIDPELGFKDMAKIKDLYANDSDVVTALMFVAMREELCIKQVLGTAGNEANFLPNSMEAMKEAFSSVNPDLLDNLKNDPSALDRTSISEDFKQSLNMFYTMQGQIEKAVEDGFDPMNHVRNVLSNPEKMEMPPVQSMDYDELD
eukprot:TRINITY_DN6858_c0_g1_i2.p1 TRINITY_DN6858_c0_g1~~TRINITY_DN6858_c0_g1_i2.p1  ORF type:complete len:203 (+),score=51.06 TRINITY_DN6858_c0_g1_i2:53-661(+)